uniref:Uncharacterized protein n=1 Tax=Kalanchoe fedtschenkoi TaxID=63787 RepID=A0A7N0UPT9_KALFE
MDSDDEMEFIAASEQPSPPFAATKMKRLKKATHFFKENVIHQVVAASPPPQPGSSDMEIGNETEAAPPPPPVEETGLGVVPADDEFRFVQDVEMYESETDKQSDGLEVLNENMTSCAGESELGAKRALDFDSPYCLGKLGKVDSEIDASEKQLDAFEGFEKEKEKKKRKKRSKGDDVALESSKVVAKRKPEKERREYLNQLHAESQRLLRETRDAGFKPAPAVHKPISSVLEKIRKRKLELQRKAVNRSSSYNVVDDNDDDDLQFSEVVMNTESIPLAGKRDDVLCQQVNEEKMGDTYEVDCGLKEAPLDINDKSLGEQNLENNSYLPITYEESKSSLRAPICETQDLFCDSEATDSKNGIASKNNEDESPLEENFVPSVLAMNLRFDSALPDDDEYSDEEDNEKENVAPQPPMLRGDPVQAFVDDEAIEEDDSDNDQLRFEENEDDDDCDEDAEDLNEMIATNYEENQIDQERRQELHMKMLEQQDAEGIDNLLLKYKCGPKLSDVNPLKDEDGMGEDGDGEEDESSDEALGAEAPKTSLRLCAKKAKQMIVQMFTDKEDAYVSSEDEELETRIVTRSFKNYDEKKKLLPPTEDESSREVFGLIKKLNIASEMKKKTIISSFDMVTCKSISSSKPSFLSRASSSSLPSSRKHGSSVSRGFVFARDDSNSRSSIAVSEDSNTVEKEVQETVRLRAKSSQSQTKQKPNVTTESIAGSSSLFEVLRRSTVQQHNQDAIVGRTQSVFASFKLPKRSKIEGK